MGDSDPHKEALIPCPDILKGKGIHKTTLAPKINISIVYGDPPNHTTSDPENDKDPTNHAHNACACLSPNRFADANEDDESAISLIRLHEPINPRMAAAVRKARVGELIKADALKVLSNKNVARL